MSYRNIEKSIIKKYRKQIFSKFIRAVYDYQLIQDGDVIAVCISGGKDSFLLAKVLEEFQRHGRIDFKLKFISMNPGYNDINLQMIKENAEKLNIDIEIFETDIFEIVEKNAEGEPCYLCAKMRRGYLYNKASELGCNKIALGHHFDDVIETIMLNVLYSGTYKTMLPKLKSDNFEGIELIRPLYNVDEKDIKAWVNYNDLTFINCGCPLACSINDSKRAKVKKMIENLQKENKYIRKNIFASAFNVNLDNVVGYKHKNEKKSYIDEYN